MTFFPRSVPNGIVVESFFSRSEVAIAIERELADHVYSYISFVKCSLGRSTPNPVCSLGSFGRSEMGRAWMVTTQVLVTSPDGEGRERPEKVRKFHCCKQETRWGGREFCHVTLSQPPDESAEAQIARFRRRHGTPGPCGAGVTSHSEPCRAAEMGCCFKNRDRLPHRR